MTRLLSLVALLALVVVACGDSVTTSSRVSDDPPPQQSTTTGAPAVTTSPTTTMTATTITSTTAAPTTTPEDLPMTIRVAVQDGVAIVDPERPEVDRGDAVEIVVTSDVADEVHIHGYDLYLPVGDGDAASIQFVADIPGIFEVELESSHLPLFDLVVS